jgi:hypothetical protein
VALFTILLRFFSPVNKTGMGNEILARAASASGTIGPPRLLGLGYSLGRV